MRQRGDSFLSLSCPKASEAPVCVYSIMYMFFNNNLFYAMELLLRLLWQDEVPVAIMLASLALSLSVDPLSLFTDPLALTLSPSPSKSLSLSISLPLLIFSLIYLFPDLPLLLSWPICLSF